MPRESPYWIFKSGKAASELAVFISHVPGYKHSTTSHSIRVAGQSIVAGFIKTNNNGEMVNNLSLLKCHTSLTLSRGRRGLRSLNQSWRQFPPSQAINVRLSSTWSRGDSHKCLFIYLLSTPLSGSCQHVCFGKRTTRHEGK